MLTEQIDHKLIQDSLNSSDTKGKSHHGYSFEDFVILAFGFTEADGSPYRDHRQGGTAKWGQPFDVPQEVVARLSVWVLQESNMTLGLRQAWFKLPQYIPRKTARKF